MRCQMSSWRARAVSRMDSYIILITKLLEDIVAKETEDASTVKIFPKWVHARLLSANVHKHFHLCVHFYFVCISIVIQHFFFACISIVLQHFFVHHFIQHFSICLLLSIVSPLLGTLRDPLVGDP